MDPDQFFAAMETLLNDAVNDVLEAIDAPDTGTRDAVQLVANAFMTRLRRGTKVPLEEVIAECYQIEPGDPGPIEWARD